MFSPSRRKINIDIYDPIVNSNEVKIKLGLEIQLKPKASKYDLVIITVPHQHYKDMGVEKIS